MTDPMGAWLLPIAPGIEVAVGRFELKYIEYLSETITLPGLPAYCEQGMLWREQFVPIIDLPNLIRHRRAPRAGSMVGIVAFKPTSTENLAIGALTLHDLPHLIEVEQNQALHPEQLEQHYWQTLAHAAFCMQDNTYPVLNLNKLFCSAPTDLLMLH